MFPAILLNTLPNYGTLNLKSLHFWPFVIVRFPYNGNSFQKHDLSKKTNKNKS